MNSRERVVTVLNRGVPDRVPVDYSSNPDIDRRLKAHFGLKADDGEGLLRVLGVDIRGIWPRFVGPSRHADIPERGIKVDSWGIHRRWVEHPSGGYWDFCDFPLIEATEEQVAAWPMPSPDDYDYSGVLKQCRNLRAYALHVGGAGDGDVINSTGMLRGMEQTLVDLVTDDPAGLLLSRRRVDIQVETLRRTIEAAKGEIDFVWMGEDLGTQIAPMISLETYRRHIRPLHQRIVDLAKSFNLPVMIHTCGSSSWAYEDFIEMGISAVDTLQPEAANMSPEYLKRTFGGRLAFHGCISTAGPLATGTVAETVAYCRRTLDIMMPGGGYCFAPTHQIQDNTPTENAVAMYETVKTYGVYK
jgi:uroporphyrinogen decarboxylase